MDGRLKRAQDSLEAGNKLLKEEALTKRGGKDAQAAKKSKERMHKILTGIQTVTTLVEPVAELNPIAKGVLATFKAVIQLEVGRRENSEQIVSVCQFMTSTIFVLHYLSEMLTEDSNTLDGEIEAKLSDFASAIEEFGQFADLYYTKFNKFVIVRFLRAQDFKSQLKSHVETFEGHQRDLTALLAIRNTGKQIEMHKDLLTNTEAILARLGVPATEDEKKAVLFIEANGGAVAIIEDKIQVEAVAKLLHDTLNKSKLETLRGDLNDMMAHNNQQYELKLEGAKMEITEAVERSTTAILGRMDAGPHDLLQDEDLKAIWKSNAWKLSIKCRMFVDALCDQYTGKFAAMENPEDAWTLKVLSKVVNHPAIGEAIDEDNGGFLSVHELNHFIKKKPEALGWSVPEWFSYWAIGWRYNNIINSNAISEYIVCLQSACKELKGRLEVEDEETGTLIDNYVQSLSLVEFIVGWLDVVSDGDLEGLEDADTATAAHIMGLSEAIMTHEEDNLRANFSKLDFVLDDPAMLPILTGQAGLRIEQIVLSLIYISLEHHYAVISASAGLVNEMLDVEDETVDVEDRTVDVEDGVVGAEDVGVEVGDETVVALESATEDPVVLESSVWFNMDAVLSVVLWEFHERMKSLLRSWRAQGRSAEEEVQCYAGGLFAGWHAEYVREGSLIKQWMEGIDPPEEVEEDDSEKIEKLSERIDGIDARLEGLDTKLVSLEGLLARILNAVEKDGAAGKAQPTRNQKAKQRKRAIEEEEEEEEETDEGGREGTDEDDVEDAQGGDGSEEDY